MTAFRCPRSGTALEREEHDHYVMWRCPDCGGRAAGVGVLRRIFDRAFANAVWVSATETGTSSDRKCAVCNNPMLSTTTTPVSLDLCRPCRFVWFDPSEFELAPRQEAPAPREIELTQDQIEGIARLSAAEIAEEWRNKPDVEIGDQLALVPGLLGLPVEEEAPEVRRVPWVTLGLAVLLTLFSTFFFDAGLYHLLTNVYFLFVFGDNVEDFLGRGHYLLLLVAGLVGGGALDALLAPEGDVFLAGVGAAMSAVIVFYGLRFPQARLRYFRLFRWLSMPASAATGVWFVSQVIGARDQLTGHEDVSFIAHLGGAAVGLWFWWLWRND